MRVKQRGARTSAALPENFLSQGMALSLKSNKLYGDTSLFVFLSILWVNLNRTDGNMDYYRGSPTHDGVYM